MSSQKPTNSSTRHNPISPGLSVPPEDAQLSVLAWRSLTRLAGMWSRVMVDFEKLGEDDDHRCHSRFHAKVLVSEP